MIGTYRRYKKKDEDWSSNIYSNTGFIRKYILPELGEQIKKAGGPEDIITSEHIQFGNLQFVYTDISSSAIFMDLHSINTENDNILVPSTGTCKPYLAGNISTLSNYVFYFSPGQNFAAVNYIVTENALILWNPYESERPALCMFILNYAGSQVTYASWVTPAAPNPGSETVSSTASIAVNKDGMATPIMSIYSGSGVIVSSERMAINKGIQNTTCKASTAGSVATYDLPRLNEARQDLHLWTPLIFSFPELLIEGSLSTKNMCNNKLLISDKTYHLDKAGPKNGYYMYPTHSPKLGTLNGQKCLVLDPGQFFPDYTNEGYALFNFSIVYIYE